MKFVKFEAEGASSGCFQISELVLTGAKADAQGVEEVVVSETTGTDEGETSANTFDFGIAAAVAAVISLAGFAASKKKH